MQPGNTDTQSEPEKLQEYNPVTFADLSPDHKNKWKDTTMMMQWVAPGFQHMWMTMLNAQHLTPPQEYVPVFTRDVPIAATDARNILLNPDTFFEVGLMERVFVAGHEILHNVCGDVEFLRKCSTSGYVPMHDGTRLKFDNDTMQKAMDAVRNAMLMESKIGKPLNTFKGQPVGHFDAEVTSQSSFIDVYKKYFEDEFGGEGGEGEQPGDQPGKQPSPNGNNPGGFDNLLPPGSATGGAPQPRDQGKWQVAIQSAEHIEKSRHHGKMPAGLERLFKQLLEPEVPWVDHIETLIMRAVGDGSFDWTQPDPWLGHTPQGDTFFAPKPAGMGAGWIVIWGDTSGSRSDHEITSNIAELPAIMESVAPRRLTVAWGDADIHHVDEIEEASDLTKLKPKGGGGTDMDPFLEWIAMQDDEPDLIIAFTDGYLDFPKEPKCPVIWASSTDVEYPYGNVVKVCKQKRAF